MMKDSDIAQIEAFLAGTLDKDEQHALEERVKEDSDFARQVSLIRDISQAIGTDVEGFKSDLDAVMSDTANNEAAKSKHIFRPQWLIAASIAIIVGLFALLYPKPLSHSELFAQHFETPAENISVRDAGSLDSNLSSAIQAYSSRNFGLAAEEFNSFLVDNPDRTDVAFYHAISLLANGNIQRAEDQLLSLKTDEGVFRNAVTWYLSLTQLKQGKIQDARANLAHLAINEETRYYERAKELLNQLDAP